MVRFGEKKKVIGKTKKFVPETNCMLNIENNRFNLNVLSKDDLMFLYGKLNHIKREVDNDFPNNKLKVSGFPITDWINDIKGKISIREISDEEKRLKNLENELDELLTNESKVHIKLDKLKGLI